MVDQEIQDLYNLLQQSHPRLEVPEVDMVHLVRVELLQLRLQTEEQEMYLLSVLLKELMVVQTEEVLLIQEELVVVEQPYKEVQIILPYQQYLVFLQGDTEVQLLLLVAEV